MQCLSGGADAGYRAISAVSNKKMRQDQTIHCCGNTCCTEVARVQVALDGKQFLPAFDNRDAPLFARFSDSPEVILTMYVDPVITGIFPPTGPRTGGIPITIFGLNFLVASYDFSRNLTFCRFRVRQQGASSLSWMWTVASFITDNSLLCMTPQTSTSVESELGITFNAQNFQSNADVTYQYFSVARVDPPFGGWLGNTAVRISGSLLNAMENETGRAEYLCKFTDASEHNMTNRTTIVPASFSSPSTIICTAPAFRIGRSLLSIALYGRSFSEDPVYFQYVDEAFVYGAIPGTGPRTGGYSVLISGENIMNSTLLACRFKLDPGLDVVVRAAKYLSPNSVECMVPTSPVSGLARVYLLNNGQQDSATFADFTYFTVVDVLPDGGPTGGGTEVRITISTDTEKGWCRFGEPRHTVEAIVVNSTHDDLKNSFYTQEEMKTCHRMINVTNSSRDIQTKLSSWSGMISFNVSGNCSACVCSTAGMPSYQRPYVARPMVAAFRNTTVLTNTSIIVTMNSKMNSTMNSTLSSTKNGTTNSTMLQDSVCQHCACDVEGVISNASSNCSQCMCAAQSCQCSCTRWNQTILPLNATYPCLQNVTYRNYTLGRVLVCRTLQGMAPSIAGSEVIFSVSLNNRDFAIATNFAAFTFFPEGVVDRLLPESGPLRGGTGVTVVGSNFFSLCRTAHDAITGFCYGCADESRNTFLWGSDSSCSITVPGSTNRGKLPWPSSRPCGLPCRVGMDDRDAFGVTGTIYCNFGDVKMPARYMTPNRIKCFSPRTPDPAVATRLHTTVSFNDQQYTPQGNLFSYYTITGVSPSSAPTYGGTIVSVEGHNLFSGARNGLEIQCLFWLDIFTIGGYDPVSDRVLCRVPEQPAEMRDNLITLIDLAVSLNRNIQDQYTDARQTVEYFQDDLPKLMYPHKGPMNGGSEIYFELPYRLLPDPDYVHVNFPFNYEHYFSQSYRNDTAKPDRRTLCFGTLETVKEKITRLPYTCCDNIATEAVCDGVVVPARFDNSSFLSVKLPPYPTPQTVNVDVALNGIRGAGINPTAQFSMQAFCMKKINTCAQANRNAQCIEHIDCGGLVFHYWGIEGVFPVAFDVRAGVDIRLIGNNFPHTEDEIGTCVFFKESDNTEIARRTSYVNEEDCDECPRKDENNLCVVERYCTAVNCPVPPAPGFVPIDAYVEAQFGIHPITAQKSKIQYYDSASVTRLDVSAGPTTGGTVILVRGVNFVNSSKLFCQFSNVNTFSSDFLFSEASFVDSSTLRCPSPMCQKFFIGFTPAGTCDSCEQCNAPVKITMNFRDFLPGTMQFAYRPAPKMYAIVPIRTPSRMQPRTSVTVTGSSFSNVGSANDVGFGLSCRFGEPTAIVQGLFHSSCNYTDERFLCKMLTCIPPRNNLSIHVPVFVGIDTQQWNGIPAVQKKGGVFNTIAKNFAYYTITRLHPPYVLSSGGALLAVTGINVDLGRAYACKVFDSTDATYSQAISIDDHTVVCTVPALKLGLYSVSISLDGNEVELKNRDYTGDFLVFENYLPALIDTIEPTKGKADGGIVVTLTGRNFWDSPLLVCNFGHLRSAAAFFVDNVTVVCTSTQQFGPVFVEVSFNGQEFSNSTQLFVNYYVAEVVRVVPDRIPAGYSRDIIIRGLYFEDFDEAACIFDVIDANPVPQYVKAYFINSTAYRCQAPLGIQNTVLQIKITLDRVEISRSFAHLYYYDVKLIEPFAGPTKGGTHVTVDGYFLNDGDTPMCQYASQHGLELEVLDIFDVGSSSTITTASSTRCTNGINCTNSTSSGSISMLSMSRRETVYFLEVVSGGSNYTDGTFPLVMGECVDDKDIVYAIEVENLATGYTDGIFDLEVLCQLPCTGTRLAAQYRVQGEVVTNVLLIEPGTGYNISHPPLLNVRGCNGAGIAGTCTPVTFQISMGRSCVTPGCCQNTVTGKYSVLKGQVQSATITDGGSGFNHRFPPEMIMSGCNGSLSSSGDGCNKCINGLFIPSGTCTSGAACACSGSQVYCQDSSTGSVNCQCAAPNAGTECRSSSDCTGAGKCLHSAKLRVLVANVTQMLGTRGSQNEIICYIPRVRSPSSVQSLFQYQSVSKQYYGMARIFIRVKIHKGEEFTTKALIYHFYDQPNVSTGYPNSASSRGGSRITVTGALFKCETDLTTVRLPDDSEEALRDMKITCRLHNSLKSQPGIFINSTHVYCQANRICFDGSTMSGCKECILEGCDQPTFDYSHSLPTNTYFNPQVALNDQDFADDKVRFHVYSISSFRPFGGVYNGGTHVSIAGINFDRDGAGPYDAHCRFSRIIVPARYDPVQELIKCLSQPLLDIYTVLEVHLGSNLSDTTLWTDNGQIFNMYTAYPPGLSVSPDSGSFTGKQPLRFDVPRPHQFNHFRFRSFDFNTNFEGVEASLIVSGQRDDDPRTDPHLITIGRIISMEVNLFMCLEDLACDGGAACLKKCKIRTQHCIWERICQLSGDCQCRYPDMLTKTYVEDSDVSFGYRRRIDEETFEVSFQIEPTDQVNHIREAVAHVLDSGLINTLIRSDWVQKSIVILNHPTLDHLTITQQMHPTPFKFFSQFAAFARFGPLITEGWVSELVAMEAEIAKSPVDSPATVQVSFCMNGQQFSQQPVSFYYYTVNWITPFGVPVNYPDGIGTEPDKTKWLSCPDASKFCRSTVTKDVRNVLATIRIYGNNFRSESRPVRGAIFENPKCRYGDFDDTTPGLVGQTLQQLEVVDGIVNFEFGFVECLQPSSLMLVAPINEEDKTRRVRVEVALNGRDFSYSDLKVDGPMGLVFFEEPLLTKYEPKVGPISGNTSIVITGKNFRKEASEWKSPTCFCQFSTNSGLTNPPFQTVPCTVLSETQVSCVSPRFSENAYGYAASTFRQPPQQISVYVSMNGFHWHTEKFDDLDGPRFSFFDVRFITPQLSAITFLPAHSRDLMVNVGNFVNPDLLFIFCWWKVPGSTITSSFVVRGQQNFGGANLYVCTIPDWSSIYINGRPSEEMLPCKQSQSYGESICNLDGSLEVPFGVAFSENVDIAMLKGSDFSLSKRYTFYAMPRFFDFLPKMGDQLGGTEIRIYGENFLKLPSLQCMFGEAASMQTAEKIIFKSDSLIVCVAPKKTLTNTVKLSLTMNNAHWMTCEAAPGCTFDHPYYNGATKSCCSWYNTIENEEKQLTSFTYARRPTLSALQPNAAPSQGDSDLKIIGNNIVTGIDGIVYACLIDGDIVPGKFNVDGGLQFMTCLTRPNMRVGELEVKVSINEFEWSAASQILNVFEPLRLFRINPSFTMWDNPITEITIIGKNFITPDAQIGSLLVRFAEFDEEGVVKWKKDVSPSLFGPDIQDISEPALFPNIVTDLVTIEPPKRSPCTQVGARFCEPGVVNVFVSQNEGTEWTWENITFTYIREPTQKTECFGGTPLEIPQDFCTLEAKLDFDNLNHPFVRFIDEPYNRRGSCKVGTDDAFGQAARSGKCLCTSSDCTSGAYDCGNQTGDVTLGCSIKAAITHVSPRSGPTAGGTFVQIRGHKIDNGTGYFCKFGVQTVPATLNTSSLLVQCETPPLLKNGSVEVEISISGGYGDDPDRDAEWTVSHGHHTFHYYAPPTIMGLEPSIGPATGGTKITITGGMTDALMALDTRYRSITTDQYGGAGCNGEQSGGLCRGMWLFGSYEDYGPITPGFETACVFEEHCEFQLYQQHDLTCRFCSTKNPGYCFLSADTTYLLPNVIQCITPPHEQLLSLNIIDPYDDVTVEVTLNGQLWHESPINFRVHAYNNITKIHPEAGPAVGGTWVTLVGTGFIQSDLTICKFGTRKAAEFKFLNATHVACLSPANTVLEQIQIDIAFNGVQFESAPSLFEYIAQWKVKKLFPQFAREVGGGVVSVIGFDFKDVSAIACKFGDHIVTKPNAVFVSANKILCRVPENIIKRPTFVTAQETCDGTYIQGSSRNDTGWTICQGCTECCNCPDCPDCMPVCTCREGLGQSCCSPADPSDLRKFATQCPPQPQLKDSQPRSLCLPPEYVCEFVSSDETTKVLECTLLKFKGTLHSPPQPTTMIIPSDMDFLHPDLALRLTLPFHVALDGQSWYSGCVNAPFLGNTAESDADYIAPPCITDDDAAVERWYGTFTYVEKYNVTNFKPGIAPQLGETPITVIGEGFVDSQDIKCRFGWKNDGTFDPDFRVGEEGELIGVEANEVSGVFVNSFTIICVSPPLDTLVYDELSKGANFVPVPLQISMNGLPMEYSDITVDFVYSPPWELSYIEPRNSPTIGGSMITFFGPYFYDSGQIMCKFGDLFATQVKIVGNGEVVCRTPSVDIHQKLNVSITVDGTSWSDYTNTTVIEYFGVRNVLLFGENDYGQLGFGEVGERVFSGKRCSTGKYGKFDCENDDDCPSGNCVEVTVQSNREPTFLDELFAHNMTGIAMGQTHTLIISSETYSDDWGTNPRRGVVYTWGDNLVGQMGFGFAGPSFFQYDFSLPSALVCLPSATYLLDRRLDSRPIVGIPDDWPDDAWIVPTCIRKQDVKTEGIWLISEFILYNPFYYDGVTAVAAGSFHSMVITESKDLYVWGWNNDGQLGMGPLDLRPNIAYPMQVVYFRRKLKLKANIVKISAGFAHSAAVDEEGRLFTWGNNKYGQLGVGDYLSRRFPTQVSGFTDPQGMQYKIVDIRCGLYHCIALDIVGAVWSFGSNNRGQLGTCESELVLLDSMNLACEKPTPVMDNERTFRRNVPKKVDFLDVSDYSGIIVGRPLITKIEVGAFHSMAIGIPCITGLLDMNDPCPAFDTLAGDFYVWGNNKYGQLGIGTYSDMTFKQLPYLQRSVNTISTRCREGVTTDCVAVEDYFRTGKRVVSMAGGSWHTLLVLDQKEKIGYRRSYYTVNRLYTFGNNDEGQLGQGDLILRDEPTLLVTNNVKFHELGGNFYQSLFTQGCPPHDGLVCNGNGFCLEQGVCDCYPGYRGFDCSIECDGGAENVCSGHGNNSIAIEIAKWRQQVILATSGHALKKRLDQAFLGYGCMSAGILKSVLFDKMTECVRVCVDPDDVCIPIERLKISSTALSSFFDRMVSEYPSLSTAVKIIRDDWPLHMYNQGFRFWKYPYHARGESLKNSTVGPSDGRWKKSDIYPILTMLQNRSTCWRSYSCEVGQCSVDPGFTRVSPGESMLDVNPGCRDGWTAQQHFQKRIEEVDQAWSNLEMENPYCDPQVVADKYKLRKEQVQFIWSVFETDAENVTNRMAADSFYKLKYPISGDPVQKVRQVWEAFDIHCQNYTIAQIVLGKFKKHPSKYFLHFGLWYRVVSKAYLLRKTQSQLSI